jgi:hypothetical protein
MESAVEAIWTGIDNYRISLTYRYLRRGVASSSKLKYIDSKLLNL